MLGVGSGATRSDEFKGELIYEQDFTSLPNGNRSSLPTGWASSISGSPTHTVYGSTNESSLTNSKGWIFKNGTTGSQYTGPGGGVKHASGYWNSSSSYGYLVYEASTPGSSTSTTKIHSMRTNELDFQNYTTIGLSFYYHAYGAGIGGSSNDSGLGLGIACTTSTTSAAQANEAGTGLGFTSVTEGGGDIVLISEAITTKRLGGTGQVQTQGHTAALNEHNKWEKARVDLSAAAGQSSCYIWFTMFTSIHPSLAYAQDICIDKIKIIGSK